MSQHDSENDIWDYRSLRKIKKQKAHTSNECGKQKRAATSRGRGTEKTTLRGREKLKYEKSQQESQNSNPGEVQHHDSDTGVRGSLELSTSAPPHPSPVKDFDQSVITSSQAGNSHAVTQEYCPNCQMPFSILLVQSQRWHVSECLETLIEDRQECPDGFRCSSTIPSHYRKYSHFLLAHSRATNGEVGLSLDSSQESVSNVSAPSSLSSSPSVGKGGSGGTPPPSCSNALLLLKSPAPEDIRKKKGWSPVVKVQKASSRGQGGGATQLLSSTAETQQQDLMKVEPSSSSVGPSPLVSISSDNEISYSPLSAHPTGEAVFNGESIPCRRSLSYTGVTPGEEEEEGGDDDSMGLYSGVVLSDDDLFAELVTQSEREGDSQEGISSSEAQVKSVTSLGLCADELNEGSADSPGHGSSGGTVRGEAFSVPLRSPQCEVLDQLRERLHGTVKQADPSTTRGATLQDPKVMAPARSKGSSRLKQTDIGVFFGLKPLQQKEPEVGGASAKENRPQRPLEAGGDMAVQVNGGRRPRKRKAAGRSSEAEVSGAVETTPELTSQAANGRRRAGRRRWSRRAEDGSEVPRPCPFYKKIPGTGFAVDAFQYGTIEGVSAYFLTHFHSDHYSGLKKSFSHPIYCSQITGNLVKSKLRVEEQYVHILPMNTECTVEGVRVILLDANHCPGAAMLLFLLPNGQTLLHTGDFRADPSMERCPELLGRRVHTLYLDTTYCSPEYSFPSQQEVITFAVNTAFEHVALNPRTLVVCGSYSVGKEKVFLAMAEVLGCRVSMSRDKFNTMCCLESDRIRQLITTDWNNAQIHVLSMMQINFRSLQAHLKKFSAKYDRVLAFRPTGWTFSAEAGAVEDIQPEVRDNISIYGIPYSEHSSYLEMKCFVQWLRPLKIIPTVNVGSWSSRKAMEQVFSEWNSEVTKGDPKILTGSAVTK